MAEEPDSMNRYNLGNVISYKSTLQIMFFCEALAVLPVRFFSVDLTIFACNQANVMTGFVAYHDVIKIMHSTGNILRVISEFAFAQT